MEYDLVYLRGDLLLREILQALLRIKSLRSPVFYFRTSGDLIY